MGISGFRHYYVAFSADVRKEYPVTNPIRVCFDWETACSVKAANKGSVILITFVDEKIITFQQVTRHDRDSKPNGGSGWKK